ncbi:uncharacterized protein [Amphiura filiformis]
MVAGTDAQEEYDPAEENAMNEKEWTAIMKKLAKVPPKQFPDRVRDLKHLTENINAAQPPPNVMGAEDFEEIELMAEEMAMDMEEEEEEEEAAAEIEERPVPVAPAMIDEGAVPPLVEEPPRVFDRIRTGKKGNKKRGGKGKGKGKGKRGKSNKN